MLANLSASNITIGKAEFRRMLCESQSAKTVSAYVFAAAGLGESTTDLAWDGQALICENGDLLAEAQRFSDDEELICADVDLDRLLVRPDEHLQLRGHDRRRARAPARDAPDRLRARRHARPSR